MRAVAIAPLATPAQYAQHHTQQRHDCCGQGQIYDCVVPCRLQPVAAQRVKPVNPGTRPIPQPLVSCRITHHRAAVAGDIEQTLIAIQQLHAVKRTVGIQRTRMGPDIFINQPARLHYRIRRKLPRCLQGLSCANRAYPLAGTRIDRHVPGAAIAQHVMRLSTQTGQTHAVRRLTVIGARLGPCQANAALIHRQWRQVCQMLSRRQLGVTHIHHHHARDKPHRHKQAKHDAKPAVPQIQVTFHHPLPANRCKAPTGGYWLSEAGLQRDLEGTWRAKIEHGRAGLTGVDLVRQVATTQRQLGIGGQFIAHKAAE